MQARNAVIIGAGPTGATLAILLARRGYRVAVFEKRADIRRHGAQGGRSINLALMARGVRALEHVGVLESATARAVPIRARAIHTPGGKIVSQPLGRTSSEHVWAVDRNALNAALLDQAERMPNVRLHFGCQLRDVMFATGDVRIFREADNREEIVHADVILGADGVSSVVRDCLVRAGKAEFTVSRISHGYKELTLPATFTADYMPEAFHSWPRGSFMIFANPNPDRSLTLTLFMPNAGFSGLTEEEQVQDFFTTNFSDLAPAAPTLVADYFRNPVGALGTVKGGPWFHEDKVLLVGDAAHAIVPFFGQGMNASLEDCVVLDELLQRHADDWGKVMGDLYENRRPNTDAVAELAMYNYEEIQARVNDASFRFRREVEFELMKRYPSRYLTMHVLVMFNHVPYKFALDCLTLQNKLLPLICNGVGDLGAVDWQRTDQLMAQYFRDVDALKHAHGGSELSQPRR
jgi:kynurenine 3-monooxygenase